MTKKDVKMRTTILFMLLFAIAFTACDDDDALCLKGDGNVQEYELDLADFDEIQLVGPVDLEIKQGPEQSVFVRAEAPMYNDLEYRVKDNELEIGYEDIRCFETDFGVTVMVTLPDVKSISVDGPSQVMSIGELDLDKLEVNVSGSAEVMLEGEAETCEVDVSGSIEMYNFGFVNQRTDIDISGSAEMEVFTEQELNIDISGSATIRYMGDPVVDENVSGTLDLIKIN